VGVPPSSGQHKRDQNSRRSSSTSTNTSSEDFYEKRRPHTYQNLPSLSNSSSAQLDTGTPSGTGVPSYQPSEPDHAPPPGYNLLQEVGIPQLYQDIRTRSRSNHGHSSRGRQGPPVLPKPVPLHYSSSNVVVPNLKPKQYNHFEQQPFNYISQSELLFARSNAPRTKTGQSLVSFV